jgi:hypothetical protein
MVSQYKKTPSSQQSYLYDWVEDPSTKTACEDGCAARNLCQVKWDFTSSAASVNTAPQRSALDRCIPLCVWAACVLVYVCI